MYCDDFIASSIVSKRLNLVCSSILGKSSLWNIGITISLCEASFKSG